jgi:hypothetical protein
MTLKLENPMKRLALPLAAFAILLQEPVQAQAPDHHIAPDLTERESDVDAEVLVALTRMTEFISGAAEFTIVAVMGHEVLQSNGQRLEFGSAITASLRRPSKANVRFENRDGDNATVVMDGATISIFATEGDAHIYDVTSQSGDIDASFVFLAEQLGTPDQLHHFFSIDLTDTLKTMVESGYYVGEATIGGVLCDNLALRNADEDIQIWIAQGPKPVPRRIVVTYKNLDGQPRFWADFKDWNFSPGQPDSVFSYSPPAHATQIEFFAESLDDE